ncbi:MAG: hypothetical protein KGH64_04945 [Candidatus Micrarchaeota archaeon]|nr:hypothetical protein [Candidatus Micrarchaeota archaeon]MDE1834659.1 hypothetical protein [Candidatus Micrarchaeota archaeon]MDE1859263.1 hypothetical protein [Candidatus Micrarchaeota archaeon]
MAKLKGVAQDKVGRVVEFSLKLDPDHKYDAMLEPCSVEYARRVADRYGLNSSRLSGVSEIYSHGCSEPKVALDYIFQNGYEVRVEREGGGNMNSWFRVSLRGENQTWPDAAKRHIRDRYHFEIERGRDLLVDTSREAREVMDLLESEGTVVRAVLRS